MQPSLMTTLPIKKVLMAISKRMLTEDQLLLFNSKEISTLFAGNLLEMQVWCASNLTKNKRQASETDYVNLSLVELILLIVQQQIAQSVAKFSNQLKKSYKCLVTKDIACTNNAWMSTSRLTRRTLNLSNVPSVASCSKRKIS